MSNHPEEIRRDIERTRAELSENVNALGDSAKPSNVVREQVDHVKEGVHSLKERIFGSDTNPYDGGAIGDVGHRASQGLEEAREAMADAPRQIRSATRGNPLVAGLVAAGIGALIGGLFPASRMETERSVQVKEAAEPALGQLREMADEAREHLQPSAHEAAEQVKFVAQSAAENLQGEASQAKDDFTQQAESSAENLKSHDKSGTDPASTPLI